ncbi:uncharacterized protein LOC132798515 [Drosophila nasuta]|uniref:uncharacterized protein LOC132798515 n=1 Tax=Drosophila nasuta TaxID=42062 RepID=UPI00295EC8B8|nr:uncharacterized protein LOC132798515 [Drosophila nasuta]
MRCIFVIVLVALSFVSTAPTRNNLVEDLNKLNVERSLQHKRISLKCQILFWQKAVENKNNKQTDIEKMQMLLDQYVYWDKTWPRSISEEDYRKIEKSVGLWTEKPSFDTLNSYVNGDFHVIKLKYEEMRKQMFDDFHTRETEIIRLYKEAGHTDA